MWILCLVCVYYKHIGKMYGNALFAYEGDTLLKWRSSIKGHRFSERWIRSTLGDLLSNIEPGSVDSWSFKDDFSASRPFSWSSEKDISSWIVQLFATELFPAAPKGRWFLVNGRLILSIPATVTQANLFGPREKKTLISEDYSLGSLFLCEQNFKNEHLRITLTLYKTHLAPILVASWNNT